MKTEQIEQEIITILQEKFCVEEIILRNKDSELKDDCGLDSLDILEAIMIFESKFQVSINDSEADTIKTINDLVTYIEKQIK
jgi:acyl carrier protein